MAKVSSNSVRVFFDEFNISGDFMATTFDDTPATPVVTTFSDIGPRRLMDNYDHASSHTGFLEPVTLLSDEFLFDALTDADDHHLLQLFEGSAEGDIAYESVVRMNGQPRTADVGGAIALNFDAAGSNGVVRAPLLGSKTSTGAEDLTGQSTGITTAGTIYAVTFRLIAFTGTSIPMTVEESQNDGGGDAYALISGLTSGALTVPGVVRATTTAASELWKRVSLAGTYSSAEIIVSAGTVAGSVPPV